MSIRKFFLTHLMPALDAFLKNYSSREINVGEDIASAGRIAEILNSLPDRLKLEVAVSTKISQFADVKAYRARTWVECPPYEYVCDFANAYKHERISRDGKKINGMNEVVSRTAYCIYRDSRGQYDVALKLLWLQLLQGGSVDVRRAVVFSAKYWTDQLVNLGFIEAVDPQRFYYSEHLSRDDAAKLANLRLVGVVGEPMTSQIVVLEYDYQINGLVEVRKGTTFDISKKIESIGVPSPFINQ